MIRRCAAGALLLATSLLAANPTEYRQKVGVYVWGKLSKDLETAAADVKHLGADRVVRVYIGPAASWDPSGKDDNSPLDVKVRRSDYRSFLAAFPVVMLTAYDTASFDKYKQGPLDAQHLTATREEFRRFTRELAKLPGRKIVSNWEFENDCKESVWNACTEYYQARLDGIRQGRKEALAQHDPGEILTAFEFLYVPGYTGKRSGLVDVGSRLNGVDFFSYSSWPSIGWDYDAPTMYKSFEWGAHILHEFTMRQKLTTRFIIGEFGEYWNLHPNSERMKALVDASIANGVEYLFDWVLYDQPGNKDDHGRDASHFGKYSLDRMLTPQGKSFRSWFPAAAN
ncbi:MAG: hypothetical protein C5B51_14915 [Terriglobia bacterium]|nr:MAG: hypothetical protein C5B51_14915 [Terriglobia bacterium]